MRLWMTLLGYLTGKTQVTCSTCKNLKGGLCYEKVEIPLVEQGGRRVCGFWEKKVR